MNTLTLEVTGMTCGHCKAAVSKALQAVSGVQSVEVDLAGGTATVQGNPDVQNLNVQNLIDAVIEEGYSAKLFA